MGESRAMPEGAGTFTAAMDRYTMDARRRLQTMEATTRLQHVMAARDSVSRKAKESEKDHAWRQRIARRTHAHRVREEAEKRSEQAAATEAIGAMSHAYMKTLESIRTNRTSRRLAAEAETNAKQEAAVAQSLAMLRDLGFEDAAACEEALALHDSDWKKAVKHLMMQER